MVDDPEVWLAAPVAPVAAGVDVRLSVLPRAVLSTLGDGGTTTTTEVPESGAFAFGPDFIGNVALATAADDVIAVGHVADHRLQAWRGQPGHMVEVADFAAPVPAGGLVALCRFRDQWHLFARSQHGRSSHLVSHDLRTWSPQLQLSISFPAFAVSGAAVRNDHLMLLGRVFVDNTAFGWGLLRSDGLSFEARPVPLPLATQLGVVGPIVNAHGDAVLLLDSGHNRTVATATGLGWTLSLLVPAVTPMAAFADHADMWLVGLDDQTGGTMLAKLNDPRTVTLPTVVGGRIRSAIPCGEHLVLARHR
jgi:hypothetical protein